MNWPDKIMVILLSFAFLFVAHAAVEKEREIQGLEAHIVSVIDSCYIAINDCCTSKAGSCLTRPPSFWQVCPSVVLPVEPIESSTSRMKPGKNSLR